MQVRRRSIAIAVALAAVLPVAASSREASAAAPGGPFRFVQPGRTIDTRGNAPLQPGLHLPLSPSSYYNLTVTGGDDPVLFRSGPCGAEPTRAIRLWPDSPSLFYVGPGECVSSDAVTDLVADYVGFDAEPGDDGFRYLQLPDTVTVLAQGAALAPGSYPLPVESVVPPTAGGVSFEVFVRGEEGSAGNYASVEPCSGPSSMIAQVSNGTPDSGDINIANVPRVPGTPLCLVLGGARPAFVNVDVLGYFTDQLAAGGDVVPSYESQQELRPGLVPREPSRVLDTRTGIGAPAAPVAAGGVLQLDLSSAVGADTAAVTLSLTVAEPDAAGYATAYGCADGLPDSSNVNYAAGATVPNLVIVEPDAAGQVCILTSARAHLLADLGGTYEWAAGLGYASEGPRRVLDTRSGPAVAAGSVTRVQIAAPGAAVVPAAVTVNLTAVDAQGWGYLTAYPCDQARPEVSNVNYVAGQTVAALATVKLGADGALCIYNYGATHVLADLAGSYTATAQARLALIPPSRWLDTRDPQVGISDAGAWWVLPVPSAAWGVIANLTATGAQAPGFLSPTTCQGETPATSSVNYGAGTDVANLAFLPVEPEPDGGSAFCVFNSSTTHVLVDVLALLTPEPAWSTVFYPGA